MGKNILTDAGYRIESLTEAGNTLDPADFFPQPGTADALPGFLHLAAGGHPLLEKPFLLHLEKEGALLLISSRNGAVHIRTATNSRHPVHVRPGETVLIDCAKAFYIQSAILPWYGDVLLIDGNTVPYRKVIFTGAENSTCLKSSESPVHFQGLHASPIGDALLENRMLTDILTDYAVATYPQEAKERDLPDYLQVLHRAVLYHPEENFSLIAYENTLGVSRYRLCREYKAAFGVSPLQDINAHRLALAKDCLLCSDMTIQEISASCGFASPTRFINLFKRLSGLTPGEFREAH